MSTHIIDHPTLGSVTVTERRGSGKLSARWKNGRLHVNIPAGVTRRQIEAALDRHSADFERIRPRPRYLPGTVIKISGLHPDCPRESQIPDSFEISIASAPVADIDIIVKTTDSTHLVTIRLPLGLDTESPAIQSRIDRGIKTVAKHLAPFLLLPRARQLAGQLGLRVDKWEIAHGRNVLGTCYPRERRIRLSCLNVFLTPELRDYIILHELAHLTEAGHTPAFHSLLDRYCRGREATLVSQLHSYPWPVER